MKRAVYIGMALIVILVGTGCGSSGSSTESSAEPATAENVSPACEEFRESLKLEEGNPSGNPRYIREDKELVQEECGAAARARWARIQHEQTPEGEEEKAEAGAENAEQVQEEAAEVEKVIKQRQAERIANELEGR